MSSQLKISFLGAAGTVTGSRYLLETPIKRVLIDCGLFQGYKNLRERNWKPFPVDPATIDAVFLTHAHLDHSGYLPKLVREGFTGKIYCTSATRDLCEILLLDSAGIQEEQSRYENKHKYSKHDPSLPLYTIRDAEKTLKQFKAITPVDGENRHPPGVKIGDITVTFHSNGHILGSSFLDVSAAGKHLLLSGDLGRPTDLVMRPPELPVYCDYLVVESTYGNRVHDYRDIWELLAKIINETSSNGGSILIPAFAVGRAQAMLHLLIELRSRKKIPPLPIYLDSPMAIRATEVLQHYCPDHRLNRQQCNALSSQVNFTRTVEESIAINQVKVPAVIISASGMATGGRVLHHLRRMLGDHRNTIIFAGYQVGGTRGARLVNGEQQIKLFGNYHKVNARIEHLDFLSAHADKVEIMRWLEQLPVAPKRCFITHGEPDAADELRLSIQEHLGWSSIVPDMGDSFEL